MIVVGGRAILAGTMTLGDFFMYIFFTGLMAAPLIQMPSIGTQISEALAGLDRIREIKAMATEDDEDATRAPLGVLDGEVEFDDVSFEYDAGRAGAEGRLALRARRHDDGAGRVERLGQEHADQPRHGLQPSAAPAACSSMAATSPACGCATTGAQLGVVLQDNFLFDGTVAENIRFARPNATLERGQGGQPHRPLRRVRRAVSRTGTTPSSASAA